MSIRTKIFAYNGIIGIQSHPESEGLIVKPEGENKGCVISAASVDISLEALELLKSVKKGKKKIGDIDIFKADEGLIIIGWKGGYLNAFRPSDIEASKDYDVSLLTATTEEIEIPQEFKNFVDSVE